MRKFDSRKTIISDEFRGIPINVKVDLSKCNTLEKRNLWTRVYFICGDLIKESNFNGEVLEEGDLIETFKISYFDTSKDYGMQEYKITEVQPDSIAQLVGYCTKLRSRIDYKTGQEKEERVISGRIYENDVFEISDWPGCLFEFKWSPREGRHLIQLLYGSHGMPNFRGFKTPISDCSNPVWNEFFSWYPKEKPRYKRIADVDWADRFVFLGYQSSYDVYVETEMGDIGEIMLLGEEELYVFHYQDLPEKYPEIVEKLKQRKLWD